MVATVNDLLLAALEVRQCPIDEGHVMVPPLPGGLGKPVFTWFCEGVRDTLLPYVQHVDAEVRRCFQGAERSGRFGDAD